jgi:hypothetical protein
MTEESGQEGEGEFNCVIEVLKFAILSARLMSL